jgi:hypothetical protein
VAHKTLYIRAADESLWSAAQRVADRADVSVSQIVAEALKHQLPLVVADIERQKHEQPVDEWAQFAADVA